MRDHRETIRSCLRLSTDKGATDGERAAARAMAEKLSAKYGVSLESASKFNFTDFGDMMRRASAAQKQRQDRWEARKREEETFTRFGTIAEFCYQVLSRDFGGSGYSYEEVLRMVAGRFPSSRTSINSLRWYETRMRKSGLFVPSRRAKPSNR